MIGVYNTMATHHGVPRCRVRPRAKDYPSAERYLAQAVLAAPEYVTAHRYYAMTLARLGRTEQSQREAAVAQELTAQQNKLSHGFALTDTAEHP